MATITPADVRMHIAVHRRIEELAKRAQGRRAKLGRALKRKKK